MPTAVEGNPGFAVDPLGMRQLECGSHDLRINGDATAADGCFGLDLATGLFRQLLRRTPACQRSTSDLALPIAACSCSSMW